MEEEKNGEVERGGARGSEREGAETERRREGQREEAERRRERGTEGGDTERK